MRAIGWLWLLLGLFELWLLIRVGALIGAFPTVMLVVATALVGMILLRVEGWSVLRRAELRLRGGAPPRRELLEAMLLALGAFLLLLPGFVGDVVGLLCILPPSRRLLAVLILRRLGGRPPPGPPPSGPADRKPRSPVTLEGEFRRDDP